MKNSITEGSFKAGEVVRAKADPFLNLVVRRYVDRVYYCKIQHFPDLKELVYFERELIPNENVKTNTD